MIHDSHIHIGYFPRAGYERPFYYSPRRILGLMNRCGVDEFIVSSTCAQVEGIAIADMVREAAELKCLAGRRAHIFCWLSGRMLDEDPELKFLDCGLYEGIKLHEAETPWNRERTEDLTRILKEAEARKWAVQFHSGESDGCRPAELAKWAQKFPSVNFDFAHCRPMAEMAQVVAAHDNVFTDCSYMDFALYPAIAEYDWQGRIMFGSDFPAYHEYDKTSFAKRYRQNLTSWNTAGIDGCAAFRKFLKMDLEKPKTTLNYKGGNENDTVH